MIQTGLIQSVHSDLVTDASYDFYGQRLATTSLDQRIKIWQLDETNNWNVEDDWKAHDAAVSKVAWAHPEFGSIIASASFDRTVRIWEQTTGLQDTEAQQGNLGGVAGGGGSGQTQASTAQGAGSRWVERAVLTDFKGTVRAVEFAPHHFGLKLATISTDNFLRVYECIEQPSLASWHLVEELDVSTLAPGPSPAHLTRVHTLALSTPTQTHATLDSASASLVAQALQPLQTNAQANSSSSSLRPGSTGNREADGGWCLSWCRDRYWGEVIAVGAGTTGVIKIIQLNSRRPSILLELNSRANSTTSTASGTPTHATTTLSAAAEGSTPSGTNNSNNANNANAAAAITSVSWAPSCGRSYHLIATAGRDGHVRIWRVTPGSDDVEGDGMESDGEDGKWTATSVADFDQHKSAVGRVEWNITGTVLSSAGNDGRVRLWKATSGNVWRPAGSIAVEQAEEPTTSAASKDVEMDS